MIPFLQQISRNLEVGRLAGPSLRTSPLCSILSLPPVFSIPREPPALARTLFQAKGCAPSPYFWAVPRLILLLVANYLGYFLGSPLLDVLDRQRHPRLLVACCGLELPTEPSANTLSNKMSDTKIRSKPSQYPFLAFHFIRACSLVCSIIVSAILLYFCYWLKHDNYKIPWTFLVVSHSLSVLRILLQLTPSPAPSCVAPHPHYPHSHLPLSHLQWPIPTDQPLHQHPSPHSMDSGVGTPRLEHERNAIPFLQHLKLG